MANVSPGVYTKIIDLSTFIQAVPTTIGFVAGYTRKGRDNQLAFVGSRAEFISEWGEPNIREFTKNYGQGPYIAYNYLGESGALYWIRVMPDDAAYSHVRLNVGPSVDGTTITEIAFIDYDDSSDGLVNMTEATSALLSVGDTKPVALLYPIGRGDYYNGIGVRLTKHSNPTLDGVYVLDIYERQSDGNDVIIESFDVSFNATAVDTAGDSIWITEILERYSSVLRATMILPNGEYTDGYMYAVHNYSKDIGTVTVTLDSTAAFVVDNKQDFTQFEATATAGPYVVIAKDAKGNEIWGYLGSANTLGDGIDIYKTDPTVVGALQGWNGSTDRFDVSSSVTYFIRKSYTDLSTPFEDDEPIPLRGGSEGSIRKADGTLNTDPIGPGNLWNLELGLQQAYAGILTNPITGQYVDEILDTEDIYFTLVYDAGYPSDVKTAISTLCTTRRDCVAILDNGDNSTFSASITKREQDHVFNNFYVSLYESFNKVSDPFTGEDVWFSPVYHMAYIIPRSDNLSEVWFAPAGFNRAAIESIKELRYNPRLGQRDQLYLKQLNPIVKFNIGYVVWGQLTSQAKASALQDLNIVRLVLFCKRAIEQFARFFIFEQNDPVTWGAVGGQVTEFLENIQSRRGLDNYSVEVSATEYEKRRKTFHVNIVLQPTRTTERIELNFFIK